MPNFEIIAWNETNDIYTPYRHNFPHLHQACEVLLLVSGYADAIYYDQFQNVTHTYHAGPGDFLLFGSLETHKVAVTGYPYHRIGVRFSLPVLHRIFHNPALSTIYNYRGGSFCHLVHLEGKALEEMTALLYGIACEFEEKRPFFPENMQYLLGQFTVSLYRYSPSSFPEIGTSNRQLLTEVQQYLQENFSRPIRIEDVACHFYVSHSYLTHSFKTFIGLTPKQYLNLCRLANARELLSTTTLPLNRIAEASGFSDTNSMVRSFRTMTGFTPGAYRKAMADPTAFTHGAPLPPNRAAGHAIGTKPAGSSTMKLAGNS